jgi:hypothetical protein
VSTPITPPRQTYVPTPSAGFDVSRLLVDGGPGLDCRYPFVSIKSEPRIKVSTAESDLLCHGLMSQNYGPVLGTVDLLHRFSVEK